MVAALAGDSTITRVPLPPFLAAGLAVVGFLVLDGLAFFVAGPSVPDLTFLLHSHVDSPRIGCLESANQPSSSASTSCRHESAGQEERDFLGGRFLRLHGRACRSLAQGSATSDATIPAAAQPRPGTQAGLRQRLLDIGRRR